MRTRMRALAGAALFGALLGTLSLTAAAHDGRDRALAQPMTPTATLTATVTVTPTSSLTATATITPTDLPAPTWTPTDAPPTVAPTATPAALYLPFAVREQCIPEHDHADIMFVLDVSRYMDKPLTDRTGRAIAQDWMRYTAEQIDLTHSKIGMVHFNRDVGVQLHLTNNRADVMAAINARPSNQSANTRMDIALRVARDELLSERATPGNAKVILFISLMQAKGVIWRGLPGCYEEIGEECAVVHAANEVKSQGIVIFSLALSWYGNGRLLQVASDPSMNYLLPTNAELDEIAARIEPAKPCPPDQFWPRRP